MCEIFIDYVCFMCSFTFGVVHSALSTDMSIEDCRQRVGAIKPCIVLFVARLLPVATVKTA